MPNEERKAHNLEHVMQTMFEQCLQHGIENTTKEMVVRASGLSRASLDRYFVNKADCVVQMAQWAAKKVARRNAYLEDYLRSGQYTGAQMLEQYLLAMKNLFFDVPYVFVLIVELRPFVFRNCADSESVYNRLSKILGNREMLRRIFELGQRDGSLSAELHIAEEVVYCNELCREFFADCALMHNPTAEENQRKIDRFIQRTMRLYGARR